MGANACDLCQDHGCYERAEQYQKLYKKEKAEVRRYRQLIIKLKHKAYSGEDIRDELLKFDL